MGKLTLVLFSAIAVSLANIIPEPLAAVNVVNNDGIQTEAQRNTFVRYLFGLTYFSSDSPTIAGLDRNQPVIILIHDHMGHPMDLFSMSVRSAIIFAHPTYNVITMDWSILASGDYNDAVRNFPAAAADLAIFLAVIANQKNPADDSGLIVDNDIHLIGFGIGAHLAGIAASQFQVIARVERITGLNPAGTNFGTNTLRLSASQADYVEVIHTDGAFSGYGIGTPIGAVDIFVNGGNTQPGCSNSACGHDRAFQIFAASLQFPSFAHRCNSLLDMTSNRCTALPILALGGAEPTKPLFVPGIYRTNGGPNFPYTR